MKESSAKAIDLLHFVCQKLIELMTSAIDLCGTQMSATDGKMYKMLAKWEKNKTTLKK